jgi:hypothetical protein
MRGVTTGLIRLHKAGCKPTLGWAGKCAGLATSCRRPRRGLCCPARRGSTRGPARHVAFPAKGLDTACRKYLRPKHLRPPRGLQPLRDPAAYCASTTAGGKGRRERAPCNQNSLGGSTPGSPSGKPQRVQHPVSSGRVVVGGEKRERERDRERERERERAQERARERARARERVREMKKERDSRAKTSSYAGGLAGSIAPPGVVSSLSPSLLPSLSIYQSIYLARARARASALSLSLARSLSRSLSRARALSIYIHASISRTLYLCLSLSLARSLSLSLSRSLSLALALALALALSLAIDTQRGRTTYVRDTQTYQHRVGQGVLKEPRGLGWRHGCHRRNQQRKHVTNIALRQKAYQIFFSNNVLTFPSEVAPTSSNAKEPVFLA